MDTVGVDAYASRGWEDIDQHIDSGWWVLSGDVPSQEAAPLYLQPLRDRTPQAQTRNPSTTPKP